MAIQPEVSPGKQVSDGEGHDEITEHRDELGASHFCDQLYQAIKVYVATVTGVQLGGNTRASSEGPACSIGAFLRRANLLQRSDVAQIDSKILRDRL